METQPTSKEELLAFQTWKEETQPTSKEELLAVLESKKHWKLAQEYRQDQTVTFKDLISFSKEDWEKECGNDRNGRIIFNILHPPWEQGNLNHSVL